MIRAAEWYIRRLGFRLVTQAPADKRPHADCFPNAVSSATTDVNRIARALKRHPDALLAARVGSHMVLDVDVRSGGPEALGRLLAHFGELPETWRAITPTGGEHIWFQHPGFRPRGKLTTGVEVITGNRLITLPPSERLGKKYRWEHDPRVPLAEAPRWLVDAVREPEAPKITCTADVPREQRIQRAHRYLELAEPAVSGNSGHSRTFYVCQLVVKGFGLEPADAFEVLSDWNGRCDPPWSERELKRKIREAARYGRKVPVGKFLEARA